jgi:predicted RNA polymerase sigma factor
VAEVDGSADAIGLVQRLELQDNYLHRQLGRATEAASAYDKAIKLTHNESERRFLIKRRHELGTRTSHDDRSARRK